VTGPKQRLPLPRGASVEITHQYLEDLLCDGGIDAMLGFSVHTLLPPQQRRLRTLLSNPEAVEQAYYRRTAIYPINHCVVIRGDALDKIPGLANSVYRAYAKAKERAYRRQLGSTLMPWGKAHWAQTFGMFDGDPLPYGLTPVNRRVIDRLARDLHEQGFIESVPDLDSLFIVPQAAAV